MTMSKQKDRETIHQTVTGDTLPTQPAETSAPKPKRSHWEPALTDIDSAYEAMGLSGLPAEETDSPSGKRERSHVYYRRGLTHAREMATYATAILDPEREFLLSRVRQVLVHAMREVVTHREAQCMELYYAQAMNFRQISDCLRINVSTISRNIQRGEQKVNRLVTLARAILGQDAA